MAIYSKNPLFGTDIRPVFSQLAFDGIIALQQLPVFVFLLFPPFVFDFFHPWEDSVWKTLTWTFTKPWKHPLLFPLGYFKTTSSFSLKQNLTNPKKREKTTLLQAYANGYPKARLTTHTTHRVTLFLPLLWGSNHQLPECPVWFSQINCSKLQLISRKKLLFKSSLQPAALIHLERREVRWDSAMWCLGLSLQALLFSIPLWNALHSWHIPFHTWGSRLY